jgi:predicted CoA-binding protein
MYGDPETIRRILTSTGDTWAVVGLSTNRARAAYGVADVLQRYGKRIVPVHPKAETVHGEQGYATLADIPFPVDVVDVFVNSHLAGAIADEAVADEAVADEAVAVGAKGLVPAGRDRRGHAGAHPRGGPGHGEDPLPGDRDPAPGVSRPGRLASGRLRCRGPR